MLDSASIRNISSHPLWVSSLYEFVAPYWDNLVNGPWVEGIAETRLSVEQMQGWILQLYPFIHDFPKFLAEGLIKVEDDFSRTFLIENIRIAVSRFAWRRGSWTRPGQMQDSIGRPQELGRFV